MGLKKNIETPEKLWSLFLDFKTWLKDTPLFKNEYNAKVGMVVQIPLERPLTWSRFDCYVNDLGIITDLEDYRTNRDNRYTVFGGVITRINKEMHADKFEGASVGIFNSNIIARDLGLKERSENDIKVTHELTPEERTKRIEQLKQKLNAK